MAEILLNAKEDFFSIECSLNDHGQTYGTCLVHCSWGLLFTSQVFDDGWVFNDRFTYPNQTRNEKFSNQWRKSLYLGSGIVPLTRHMSSIKQMLFAKI